MKSFKQIEDFFGYARTFTPPSDTVSVNALDTCLIWDDDNSDSNERHFGEDFWADKCKDLNRYSHPYLFAQASIFHDHIVISLSHEMRSWKNGSDHGITLDGNIVKFILSQIAVPVQ